MMKTLGLILMLALGAVATTLLAQETPRPPRAGQTMRGTVQGLAPGAGGVTIVSGAPQQGGEVEEALQAWKDAESEDDREAARAKLRDALVKEYDRAIEEYEKYLDDLSKRLEELRAQVDERREAQEKVIDLRLEMLLQEADGLGWPGDRRAFRLSLPGFNPFEAPMDLMPAVPTPPPSAGPAGAPGLPRSPAAGGGRGVR